jgi:hypothetical protein
MSGGQRLERLAERRLAHEHHRQERLEIRTMNIGRLTSTVTRVPKDWRAPNLDGPLVFDEMELEPLGEAGGYKWWSHPLGELRERPERLTDRDVLPSRPMIQTWVNGRREYRVFELLAPGSYGTAIFAPSPKPPKPSRPIDALGGLSMLGRQVPIAVAPSQSKNDLAPVAGPSPHYTYVGTYKTRGAAAIVARLIAKGYHLAPDTTGSALCVSSPGGKSIISFAEIEKIKPLVQPYLRDGKAPACTVKAEHPDGTDTEAVTTVLGGALACQSCLDGAS